MLAKQSRLQRFREERRNALTRQNKAATHDLEEMNVSVNEARHIYEQSTAIGSKLEASNKRYRKILKRQKLVSLVKAQGQEVEMLRVELERLRLRTYPALFQKK